MKVAYIMSRFPNLTETFVLYEILALERQGVVTTVYPLLRTRQRVLHPEAESVAGRAHYHRFLSLSILRANWHFLCRRPRAYLGVLAEVLRGTWGSANFFFGAVGIFPKAVRFAYEMAAEGVTHVHAHFSNHPTVAALIVHRLTGIPFSFTAHGHDVHVDRRMLEEKVNAAEFAVMISEYNERLVMETSKGVDPEKIHIIHCGADTELFLPRTAQRTHGRFSIVCTGSFIEVKGHRYLLEACRVLKERDLDFCCHLIGDGPERCRLVEQIAAAGLERHIILEGTLPRPAVVELMRGADVVVQPSVPTRRGAREGIPVSLMEGMACGLPVVASRISGIPELVEDGCSGLLIPPRDAQALAQALARLLEDPRLRYEMGKAGRKKVCEEFDLAHNAARLVDLIGAVASSETESSPRGTLSRKGGR